MKQNQDSAGEASQAALLRGETGRCRANVDACRDWSHQQVEL
jgi:hypothetical protein